MYIAVKNMNFAITLAIARDGIDSGNLTILLGYVYRGIHC